MAFYDTIKLEKGMYGVGSKSFTTVLEELDPTENYMGSEFENLDAYQRQLKRFDIKVSGKGCDVVEKFFSTTESAVLFPEFIARAVKQGLDANDAFNSILASKIDVDGMGYRALKYTVGTENTLVSEGAQMRTFDVTSKVDCTPMYKHGRAFSSTYETIRFQNLDILSTLLRKIGMDLAHELLSDAAKVLMKDNSTSSANEATTLTSAMPLTYTDLLKMWERISPFKLNTMLANPETMRDILNLAEMKDANAGLDFQGTGRIITPLGAKLIPVAGFGVEEKTIIGFDKDFALQMIQSGDVIVDYDKIVNRQLGQAGISITTGFNRICKDAVVGQLYSV